MFVYQVPGVSVAVIHNGKIDWARGLCDHCRSWAEVKSPPAGSLVADAGVFTGQWSGQTKSRSLPATQVPVGIARYQSVNRCPIFSLLVRK